MRLICVNPLRNFDEIVLISINFASAEKIVAEIPTVTMQIK